MAFLSKLFKPKAKEQMAEGEEEILPRHNHDHSAQQKADPYKWEIAHRRLAWLFRLAVVIIVCQAIGFVAAMETIVTLIDNFEPKVALLRSDPKDDKLYRVEPIREDIKGFDALMEAKARRYVRLMLEVDDVTQSERFREAFRMTDQKYYLKFKKERIDSGEIQKIINENGTRSITVETINRIENNKGLYKFAVDFIQTDAYPGKKPQVKQARAYLSMTTRPHEVKAIDKYENPLGITVLDMSLKEKRNK